MLNEFEYEAQKEKQKLAIEYIKFYSTLSTGSVVLLLSFLDKLDTLPKLGYLPGVAFVSFMVVIVSSLSSYGTVLKNFGKRLEEGPDFVRLFISMTLTWIGFSIAIIALTIFALVNL